MPESLPILLIEDDRDDAALTVRTLRRAHVWNEIVVVSDGIAALRYLFPTAGAAAAVASRPVLILLDLRLPRMHGIDVLRRIRADESTRDVAVVILTSDQERADKIEAATLGIHAFVNKPLDFAKLVRALGSLSLSLVLTDGPTAAISVPISGGSDWMTIAESITDSRRRLERSRCALDTARARIRRSCDRLAITDCKFPIRGTPAVV
jgi:two-component system, response regulator